MIDALRDWHLWCLSRGGLLFPGPVRRSGRNLRRRPRALHAALRRPFSHGTRTRGTRPSLSRDGGEGGGVQGAGVGDLFERGRDGEGGD